jgi:hypothetical protein
MKLRIATTPFEAVYSSLIHSPNRSVSALDQPGSLNVIMTLHSRRFASAIIMLLFATITLLRGTQLLESLFSSLFSLHPVDRTFRITPPTPGLCMGDDVFSCMVRYICNYSSRSTFSSSREYTPYPGTCDADSTICLIEAFPLACSRWQPIIILPLLCLTKTMYLAKWAVPLPTFPSPRTRQLHIRRRRSR